MWGVGGDHHRKAGYYYLVLYSCIYTEWQYNRAVCAMLHLQDGIGGGTNDIYLLSYMTYLVPAFESDLLVGF